MPKPEMECLMTYLSAGASAPDFTLQDQQNNPVQLSALLKQQRVLVYFYPKAMTPGCTVQACALRDSKAELAEKGVTVVGISTDPVKSLAKFVVRDQLRLCDEAAGRGAGTRRQGPALICVPLSPIPTCQPCCSPR